MIARRCSDSLDLAAIGSGRLVEFEHLSGHRAQTPDASHSSPELLVAWNDAVSQMTLSSDECYGVDVCGHRAAPARERLSPQGVRLISLQLTTLAPLWPPACL